MSAKKRACIIGAGTAGLCALKSALQAGMEAVAYEKGSEIGGIWVYSEIQDNVECEEDIQSSIYVGLRTNLPKEVMGYPDYDYPDNPASFISSQEVLEYLQSYVHHFELGPHIKLQHEIIRVRPWNCKWEVLVRDNQENKYFVESFDSVVVCNGHYTTPAYPDIENMDIYKGVKMHSHLYRKPDMFKDGVVLIIGCGPSGMDLSDHIHRVAKKVFLSHHSEDEPGVKFMPNVEQKPDVRRFTETGAIFNDGSEENFDYVIFCTGYKYTFPFLSVDCGLTVDDNFVYPLYKHCISINHPTMAFIGLLHQVCPAQSFDLQARFVAKFFSGQKELPPQQEMLSEAKHDMEERWASGLSKKDGHRMGRKQFEYYKDLADTAGIENLKPVVGKLMLACARKYFFELESYRNTNFKVVDSENFTRII